jgi:hypothetical protein
MMVHRFLSAVRSSCVVGGLRGVRKGSGGGEIPVVPVDVEKE